MWNIIGIAFASLGGFFILLLLVGAVVQVETIFEHEKGLLYSKGRFVRVLLQGRHWLFKLFLHQTLIKVNIQLRYVTLTGQEILTKDQINLKISLFAQYKVVDPVSAVLKVEDYAGFMYQEIQIALRSLVSAHTLDELLETKSEISQKLTETVKPKISEYGIELVQAGIKDMILPGEIKSILSKTVEAEKAAKASLITAREELASARCQANTAKLLDENPAIFRIKELQAIADFGKKPGNTLIFVSSGDLQKVLRPVQDAKSSSE